MARGPAGAIAAAGVGCTGDEEPQRAFTATDATRIAAVRPDGPDWAWPAKPDPERRAGLSDDSAPPDPIAEAYRARTRALRDGWEEAAAGRTTTSSPA